MNLSTFSQDGYPKMIVYDNDTAVLISTNQMKELNLLYIEKNYYNQLSTKLEELNGSLSEQNNKLKLTNSLLNEQNRFKDTIIVNKDVIIKSLNKDINKNKKFNRTLLITNSISIILIIFLISI